MTGPRVGTVGCSECGWTKTAPWWRRAYTFRKAWQLHQTHLDTCRPRP